MRSLLRLAFRTTLGLCAAVGFAAPAATSFSTGGHTVYHLRPATIDRSGKRVIISAAYDGAVLCHTPEGRLCWKAETGEGFPFDLCVADINGDGLDETLVASSGGAVYALGPEGKRLWSFHRTPPLFQVCAAKQKDGKCIVLAGGVEQVLYALSPAGQLLGTLRTDHCIRHVRAGDILGDGRELVALATAGSGLYGPLSLFLVDPVDLHVLWKKANLDSKFSRTADAGRRFYSMVLADINQDGKQEIVLSTGACEHGRIVAIDPAGRRAIVLPRL